MTSFSFASRYKGNMSRESASHHIGTSLSTIPASAPRWLTVLPTSASPPSATPDPVALLSALRRRWRLAAVLSLALSTGMAALVYLEMPPPKYKAQSMLLVATQAPRVVLDTKELQTDFKTYQKTQEAYIHSRLVLDAALSKEGIRDLKFLRKQSDPATWLEKQILVDFAFGSEILRIGMIGEDPNALAALVNAVTEAYMEKVVDSELRQRRDRQKLLKDNWEKYQARLKGKRSELKRLGELAGSNDKQALALVHVSEQDRLARAEAELGRIQSEVRSLGVELALLEKQKEITARKGSSESVEEQIAKDPEVASLASRVEQARMLKNKVERVARKSTDAAHADLRRELRSATKALTDRIEKVRPTFALRQNQASDEDLQLKIELTQERLNALSRQAAVLTEEVNRRSDRAKVISRTSVDLDSIQEEIFAADDISKKLAVEVESLNVELQAPARVCLIQRADVPRETDKNRVIKAAGGAGTGMLVLSLAMVSLWEFRARRIESVHEVESKLGIRVVGNLPALPDLRTRKPGNDHELEFRWKNQVFDAVDAARTAILHASRIGDLRVLMVTSSAEDEGTSSLACHLAASLARSGRKTLLIDFDVRHPSVHSLFELGDAPGVSEILRGEATASDVAVEIENSGLWVIPAGRCNGTSVGAMARDEVRLLIEQSRNEYSFIVVDSAPVLQVTDALQVGQHVDAALLSVMRGVSRSPEVYSSCRRLAALGIPLFGAVLTEMQSESYGRDHFFPDSDQKIAPYRGDKA